MPAIITHHIFGEDAATSMPQQIFANQEDIVAFLLGNQGPDPLWARSRTLPHVARQCHKLANRMHQERVTDALMVMRASVTHLNDADKNVGRAFALGWLAHYLLDSITHPLIYAQQHELKQADPQLQNAGNELHALLESDIDSWTLWQKRQKTILEMPAVASLAHTARIDRIAGALVSQVAWEVYGIDLGAAEYGRAVTDYRLMYRLIDPPSQSAASLLIRAELLVRPHSRLCAQAHVPSKTDECPSANLEHHAWTNPFTGERSVASFPDLFHDALLAWPTFSLRYIEGDRMRLDAMIGGLDYNGKPMS